MIYLASPYSHQEALIRSWRYFQTCRVLAELVRRGIRAISPVVHWHATAIRENLPHTADFWRRYDEDLLLQCQEGLLVVTLPKWKESVGVAYEIDLAQTHHLPLGYILADNWNNPYLSMEIQWLPQSK